MIVVSTFGDRPTKTQVPGPARTGFDHEMSLALVRTSWHGPMCGRAGGTLGAAGAVAAAAGAVSAPLRPSRLHQQARKRKNSFPPSCPVQLEAAGLVTRTIQSGGGGGDEPVQRCAALCDTRHGRHPNQVPFPLSPSPHVEPESGRGLVPGLRPRAAPSRSSLPPLVNFSAHSEHFWCLKH